MLASRQERGSGEDIWVPEGDFASPDALIDETLPGIVLKNQVAQQGVVRVQEALRFGRRRPGLPLEQVVHRHHRLAADGNTTKQQQRQDQESCRY